MAAAAAVEKVEVRAAAMAAVGAVVVLPGPPRKKAPALMPK